MTTFMQCLKSVSLVFRYNFPKTYLKSCNLWNHSSIINRCLFCHLVESDDQRIKECKEEKCDEDFDNAKRKETLDSDTFGTLKFNLEDVQNSQKRMQKKNPNITSVKTKSEKDISEKLKERAVDVASLKTGSNVAEHAYSINENDDTDIFGTLADESVRYYHSPAEMLPEDDDDDKSYAEFSDGIIERNPQKYFRRMQKLVKDRKLKEAQKIMVEMKQNRVNIIKPIYTLMIGAYGRVGFTRMSFSLFKQMRDSGLNPTPATLTGLFNACAESPFPETAIKKVRHLHEKIKEKGWLPSTITYHAMIKAYGRCGDIKAAFQVVDEMIKEKHRVTSDTFNFLLMACITDKEAGYTLAVLVMRKMRRMRISYNPNTFNLFLRAVRDCGVGPPELSSQLLWTWKSSLPDYFLGKKNDQKLDNIPLLATEDKKLLKESEDSVEKKVTDRDHHFHLSNICSGADNLSLPDQDITEIIPADANNVIKISHEEKNTIPNLLASRPVGQVIGIERVTHASERLALVGGLKGLIGLMHASSSEPNLKTFTLLLECIPSTLSEEHSLLEMMKLQNVKPDVDFFNLLIKRRNLRKDFAAAKDVLSLINKHGLYPDIVTFGVLALGCWKKEIGMELLKNMQDAGLQPNVEIIGAMVQTARKINDPWYLVLLMRRMKDQNVSPDPCILEELELAKEHMKKALLAKEHGEEVQPVFKTKKFEAGYRAFRLYYSTWLQQMPVDLPQHPWDQYKIEEKKEESGLSV